MRLIYLCKETMKPNSSGTKYDCYELRQPIFFYLVDVRLVRGGRVFGIGDGSSLPLLHPVDCYNTRKLELTTAVSLTKGCPRVCVLHKNIGKLSRNAKRRCSLKHYVPSKGLLA